MVATAKVSHPLAAAERARQIRIARIRLDRLLHGGAPLYCVRFGRPSNYSLSHAELAGHIRQLRREGWQSWEIRTRFDFSEAA